MSLQGRNEVHLVNANNGHHLSVDCWCEPVGIHWMKSGYDIAILVVDHDDDSQLSLHHYDVLEERDASPDWVTSILTNTIDNLHRERKDYDENE